MKLREVPADCTNEECDSILGCPERTLAGSTSTYSLTDGAETIQSNDVLRSYPVLTPTLTHLIPPQDAAPAYSCDTNLPRHDPSYTA